MLVFRFVNNLSSHFLGPIFDLMPIIVYCLLKFKTRKEPLPEGHSSFERRGFALLFDFSIIFILDKFLYALFSSSENSQMILIWGIAAVFSFLNLILLPSYTGWSLGKKLFKIKIVKKDYAKAGFFDIFSREVIKSWFSMTMLYMGCFWMLIGKKKLTWHDSVSDTIVVHINFNSIKC